MNISLEEYIKEGLTARNAVDLEKIKGLVERIYKSFRDGGKIIAFGNGGSAADAQHFVAELDGHFSTERVLLLLW